MASKQTSLLNVCSNIYGEDVFEAVLNQSNKLVLCSKPFSDGQFIKDCLVTELGQTVRFIFIYISRRSLRGNKQGSCGL